MSKKRIFKFLKWSAGILASIVLLITLMLYIFKDDICGVVVSELNKHLKTKVEVTKVDLAFWGSFPNLSVDFDHVFIQDSTSNATELDTLLFAKKIRFKFNPIDLWNENYNVKFIEINQGTFKMKVDELGMNNYDILRQKEDTTVQSPFDINLEAVTFEGFNFAYINQSTHQIYQTLIHEMKLEGSFHSSIFTTKTTAKILIVNAQSGEIPLVSNQPAELKVEVNVNKDSNSVSIPESTIFISDLPFIFSGEVNTNGFEFHLKGKNLNIKDAANKLALKQLNSVQQLEGQGVLKFNLDLSKESGEKMPLKINCSFGIVNGNLHIPNTKISMQKIKVEGSYSNANGAKKERLELKNISFKTTGGPFKGNLTLTQFKEPIFKGNADGLIDLNILHSLFPHPAIEKLNGQVKIRSSFLVQGKPTKNGEMDFNISTIEGELNLKEVLVKLNADKRVFKSINGKVYLRNNAVGMDDISLKIGQSDFQINGVLNEIIPYFKGKGKLDGRLNIKSNKIILQDLGTETKKEKNRNERAYILNNEIGGSVFLEVNELHYEKHVFSKISGNMMVNGRSIHFPKIALENGGARIKGSVSIQEKSPEIFYISSKIASKNISFQKLFKEWDNFKQEVITSENIEGVAIASVKFDAPFDLRSGIISSAIESEIGIQIDNGRLKNLKTFSTIIESLKTSNLKSILGKENINDFGNRLKDLKFDQLKNTIIIKNGVLILPSMSINSSAINIEVSGKHTFTNKIDYRFGFRFRDLKKKQVSEFGEIEDDGTGFRVFMRMYGDLNNPTIVWDRESKKEIAQEKREEEKQNAKSILKTEFGLFKNDTTVHEFIKEKGPKEEISVDFDPIKAADTIIEQKPPKKDTKVNRWLDKMKKEAEQEEKEDFIIE